MKTHASRTKLFEAISSVLEAAEPATTELSKEEKADRVTWTRRAGQATRYMEFTFPHEDVSWAKELAPQLVDKYGILFGQYAGPGEFDARRVGTLESLLGYFKAWMIDLLPVEGLPRA